MTDEQFRSLGHDLVDRIADFLASHSHVSSDALRESPEEVRAALDATACCQSRAGTPVHCYAEPPTCCLSTPCSTAIRVSMATSHPAPAPIGMLADLLAAAVNANVGAWKLAPMATEIEGQVIRWLAQFIGYPADCGGLLLSGGNMANLTCFLAARAAQAGWDVRKQGVAGGPRLCVYASTETHTWIQKAADLAGLGTDAIHWIDGPQADGSG